MERLLGTARANDDIANGDSPLHNNLPPDLDTGRVSDSQSVASQPLHINLRPTDRVSGDRGTHRSSGNEEHVTGLVSQLIARQENGDVGSYCVVAPQLRTKTTAWVFPLGEGYVPMMSLLHKPPVQPIRDALTRRADVQNETNLKASPERNAVPSGSRFSGGRLARDLPSDS